MTSKTHVVLGICTSLIILQIYPSLDMYDVVSGVGIGSLIPDLDIKKSDPSQILPPISAVVDKFTKHRGFTHTMFPLLLIIAYFLFKNDICLWMGIGALTHLIIDVVTLKVGIKCNSRGERIIYLSLWTLVWWVIMRMVYIKYNLEVIFTWILKHF